MAIDIMESIWSIFTEEKNNGPKRIFFGFSEEIPKVGKTFRIKAGMVENRSLRMVNMITSVVTKVTKINPFFIVMETECAYFIICSCKDIKYEVATYPVKEEKIIYNLGTIYICESDEFYFVKIAA